MPLTANDRLTLVRVKVERAKKHLRELELELRASREKHLHVVLAQADAQAGQGAPNLKKLPKLPFDATAAAGDVVHSLRSALDHLANQLVWVGSGREPSRRVGFPIAKDAEAYEAGKAAGKVEGMRPEAIKAIDRLKPYKGGNDPLWRIHELDNIDKHRALFTVDHDCLFFADWFAGHYLLKASNPNFRGIFDAQVEQDVQLQIEKAAGNPEIVEGDALLPSLHQLVDFVDNVIQEFALLLEQEGRPTG